MAEATREILWNVQPWMKVLLYGGAAVALLWSAWRLYRRVRVWRRGLPADYDISWRQATRNVAAWIGGRGKMNRDRYAGVMHLLILWGFILLFIGTVLVFFEHQTPLSFFHGPFYLVASLFVDLGGVAFLVGLGMAVHRRYVSRKQRLRASGWVDSMLLLMILIGVSGFILEGSRIGVDMPDF
jgi:nitrate reductase gamma subunit